MARAKTACGQMELPLDWQGQAVSHECGSPDWQATACKEAPLDWQEAAHKELLASWREFTERTCADADGCASVSTHASSNSGVSVVTRADADGRDQISTCANAGSGDDSVSTCANADADGGASIALTDDELAEVEYNKHVSQLAANPSKAFLEGLDENRRRFPSDFDCICDFDSLYHAHRKARLGKLDYYEVLSFEERLGENLARLHDDLISGDYQMHGYYSFVVHEPKERLIHAAHYVDRVVLHSICDNVLTPVMERRLIHDNAACRRGKGTHFALDRFEMFLREQYRSHGADGYALKCDITKYFASIDHEILLRRLRRVIRDRKVFSLLEMYIRSYHTEGAPGKGLPLGNQSSQSFALFYLDPVDRLVKEKFGCKHYIRYMDDFLVVHHDKQFLREVLSAIDALCGELGLSLNKKTRIIPLRQGVEFLGWRFILTGEGRVVRKVRKQTKQRFKGRMRELAFQVRTGRADWDDVWATLASYSGHFKHGDAYMLRQRVYEDFWRHVNVPVSP